MKKYILLIVVCFCSLHLSAQNWQALYDSSNDCWGRDWQACKDVLAQALVAAREEFGEADSNYIMTLYSLGMCESSLGEFPQAFAYFQEAVSLTEEHLGKNNPEYGRGLADLGNVFIAQGRFEEAIAYYDSSRYWTEKSLGKEHAEYSSRLVNLGFGYQAIGDYEQGQTYLQEALSRTAQTRGKTNLEYGLVLNHLGRLSQNMGQYKQSLLYYQEALSITEESVGKQHPVYGVRLNNIGLLYEEIGNFEQAFEAFQTSLSLAEKTFGIHHPEYAVRCSNLANIYAKQQQYEKAQQMYEESIRITEQIHGNTHPEYGLRLNNLGNVYVNQKQPEKGLPIIQEAVQIIEGSLGKSHPLYGKLLINLAGAYKENKDYDQSIAAFNEALKILSQNLGKEHPSYGVALLHAATLAQIKEMETQAIRQFSELSELTSSHLSTQLGTLPDRVQTSILHEQQIKFDLFSSASITYPTSPDLQKAGYNQQLFLKGLIQRNQADLLNSLRIQPDSLLQTQFEEWRRIHRLLAYQYQKPLNRRISSFDSLRLLVDQLELQLAHQSVAFREARQAVNWTDVQHVLEEGEVAIEFAHFPFYDKGRKTDSIMYVAFVLRQGDAHPQMVSLFEEKELQKQVDSHNQQESLNQLYEPRGIKPRRGKTKPTYLGLADLIWKPIDSLLVKGERIYYSPTGLLNRINLGAIPLDKKRLVSDTYELIQLGSTRSLVFEQERTTNKLSNHAVLFGGIQYDRSISPVTRSQRTAQKKEETDLDKLPISSRGNLDTWTYLTGSAVEVQTIQALMRENTYEVQLFMDSVATEESLRNLSASPRILHFATHGYFFPDPTDTSQNSLLKTGKLPPIQLSDHPMVRSGLILAGANHAWAGNPVPEGQEDGILTAYEISRMDLSHTELVVLSACETGLGDIQGNEGVYGLQRAFKIAGAKYVMMSLWQVPDKATQELMTAFYEKWLGGMEIRTALQTAQKQMRKKYKEPYYWAGFVLIE